MEGTDAVRRHVAHMRRRGLRPNTITLRLRVLRRLEIHANKPLLRVRLDDIRAFVDRLDDSGSRAAETTQLRSFFQWAAREGYVAVDPTVRLEPVRKRKYLPRPIPDDELARALQDPPERIAGALWLAAYAGLRACDLAPLRGEHLLLERDPPIVFVEESKGGKPRTVPLAPLLVTQLHGRVPVFGWLFPRRDGRDGHLPPHMISKLANDHLHGLGIDHTLHSLRHWFGTQSYVASGRDLVTTQQLMGHESITTTRGYTWVDPGLATEAVTRLPSVLLRSVDEEVA